MTLVSDSSKNSLSVLVVEDNRHMLFLAERILRSQGCSVLTADNGQAALDICQQRRGDIDVVLLDLGLPGISGQDVLRQIISEDPQVKVIVTSGYLEPETFKESAGRIEFLHKPYTPDQVVDALKKLTGAAPPSSF